ncbi:rhamnogalacturonan acetylesterase [Colletotrichum incanum]|uniref:Rhamnogalacturonan acetylesterase n=1 Tax=Colletotrichum incanum TaxID=1573173 RepID=A0A167AS86_COLIC|nr:rhamnogalacturonan acetylesterase [Colletotrichum incanum]
MRIAALLVLFAAVASAAPKLLICSDSTTANYATGSVLQGWGFYIHNYLTIPVTNLAVNGRSTRSFINEGKWASLLAQTSPGDFVLIEMGHNDDGDPKTDTKNRATLPGIGGDSIVVTTSNGTQETVHSFGWYLREMIADVQAKKAVPVLSGMVPRNYWTGNTLRKDWPFADYAKQVAQKADVAYVDHTTYSVAKWQLMGPITAKTYFPQDNTHTNWPGAEINSETFAQALNCGNYTKDLKQYLNAAVKDLVCK